MLLSLDTGIQFDRKNFLPRMVCCGNPVNFPGNYDKPLRAFSIGAVTRAGDTEPQPGLELLESGRIEQRERGRARGLQAGLSGLEAGDPGAEEARSREGSR